MRTVLTIVKRRLYSRLIIAVLLCALVALSCGDKNQQKINRPVTCNIDSGLIQITFTDYFSGEHIKDYKIVIGRHMGELPPDLMSRSYPNYKADKSGFIILKKDSLFRTLGGWDDVHILFLKENEVIKLFSYDYEKCKNYVIVPTRIKRLKLKNESTQGLDSILVDIRINGIGDPKNLLFNHEYPYYGTLLIEKKNLIEKDYYHEIVLLPRDIVILKVDYYSMGKLINKKKFNLKFQKSDSLISALEL